MKNKKISILLLSLVTAISLMTGCQNNNSETTVSASNSVTKSEVTTTVAEIDGSTVFAGGQGTAKDPWRIETAEQFDAIHDYLDGHFMLNADIDLAGYENWSPIGFFESKSKDEEEEPNMSVAFVGSFDGNSHTILNVTIDNTDMMGVGLFGCIAGEGSYVKNLTVENAVVNAGTYAGCVIGFADWDAEIDSIILKGNNELTGNFLIGGIVGAAHCANLTNCVAEADVILNGDGAQGAGIIVGGAEECSLESCRAAGGSLTVSGIGSLSIGGLAGCTHLSEYVRYCSAENITITAPENSYLIGGLVGHAGQFDDGTATEISNCSTDNVVITAADSADRIGMIVGGGFYGSVYAEYYPEPSAFVVTDCTANGTIEGGKIAGAIAGYIYNNSSVKNCTSEVTVNGNTECEQVGGDADSVSLDMLN